MRTLYQLPEFRFDYTAEEIPNVIEQSISETEAAYQQIEQIPLEDCTFDNVVRAHSLIDAQHSLVTSPITFLQYVSDSEAVRQASREACLVLQEFGVRSSMREPMYQRMKYIDQTYGEELNEIDHKLMISYIHMYKHMGLQLRRPRRERLQRLMNERDELEIKFEENMSEDPTHIILTTEELDGVDDLFLTRTAMAENPGYHKITHKYPDVTPILEFCHNGTTRQKVLDMYQNRCRENLDILIRLHRLRTQIANEVGFKTSSDYRLEYEMAGSSQAVHDFLHKVLSQLDPSTRQYVETIRQMKSQDLLGAGPETRSKRRRVEANLGAADYSYYHNLYLKKNCQIDPQEVKKFFPAEYVIEQMLEFYAEMFHLKFIPTQTGIGADNFAISRNSQVVTPWHADVLTYLIEDNHGNPMGYFYLDLYPREGKYTHYAVWPLIGGYQLSNGIQNLPVSAMVCNFPEPSGNTPSLLNIHEVQTLFHEFGHVLHNQCGGADCPYSDLSGTNTETDFVEAPSQMKEQWVYEPAILARISRHYQTGVSLPAELVEKLVNSRYVGASREWTRITSMALVDWTIHNKVHLNQREMVHTMMTLMSQYLYQPSGSGNRIASWGHMGGGYDSKYYSYVWTIVLASDLYSKFVNDPLNRSTGLEYRQKILSPGGTKDGSAMIKDFLGRDPSLYAFLTHYIGVKPQGQLADLTLQIDEDDD